MKKVVTSIISLIMVGCSAIPHTTKRYKEHLNSNNGRNINVLIERTEANKPYKVGHKGEYKWYYHKVLFKHYNLGHTEYKIQDCQYVYITTLQDIIVDNIIQTPQTCKSGYSGIW